MLLGGIRMRLVKSKAFGELGDIIGRRLIMDDL